MRISGRDIYIAQGDSGNVKVEFEEELVGKTFTIYINGINKSVVGSYTPTSKSVYFALTNEHTERSGKYYYDLILEEGAAKYTLINKSIFSVENTARTTNINTERINYGINPEVIKWK